ncbi:MAG: hypothetical protein Q9160_006499 [Pyrenula sp. 1 TL-2023]
MSPTDVPIQRNIFLFGDLTIAFEQELRQLLHIRDNASLRDLFDRVNWAFRHEFSKLPAHEQDAVGPSHVTVSGPPSVLSDFVDAKSLKASFLPIESPYHASHLCTAEDVEEIVGPLCEGTLAAYKLKIPVLSPVSGTAIAATDYASLLRQAVENALCGQLRWDRILSSCIDLVSQFASSHSWNIWPVASNAAEQLSNRCNSGPESRVSLCNLLNTRVEVPLSESQTGKFGDSKIAVIGFSGRFPEAASSDDLWEVLHAGRDTHRTVPADRFDWEAHFDPTGKKKNTSQVKYGCFINEPGLFDARFFNLSPREAENTDPAQRLVLMSTYEALEMAGVVPNRTPSTQQDRVGVFMGVTSDDWREVNNSQNIDTYFIPGGIRAFIPGRISYFFRFSGPSLSVDTACSSSFAAIQTACGYLWRGECDTAIAGGTNVLTNPDNFAGLDRGHFLSKEAGNCNAFDDEASGYCRADAVASVILKRLEDAQADNDPIYGLITAATTNHCGQTNSITRPHEGDQVSLFRRMLRQSNTNPLDVSYVEMHGTGTQAGDLTEMNSVLSAFVPGRQRMPRYPLHLGAVKSNLGHSESASGVSALIKVLLMMQRDEIPPHCGIKSKINRKFPLDLAERNVHIALKPTAWSRKDCANETRLCFLNNFSAAGGNTALLVEDAPKVTSKEHGMDLRTFYTIAVTAKSSTALVSNIASLITHLDQNPAISIPALSYTTTARRVHHKHRMMVTGDQLSVIKSELEGWMRDSDQKAKASGAKISRVAWVFTGQGDLYAPIGKQLFESIAQFRANIVRFDRISRRQGFSSFLHLVDSLDDKIEIDNVDTTASHLALVCVQMALSNLWKAWGVRPTSVTGHSIGEYAALYSANVLTANDTIYLVGTRARLMTEHCTKATHSMLAVMAPLGTIKPNLNNTSCEVACINSPSNTVISGPKDEVSELMKHFYSRNYKWASLQIPYACHSAQVDPILREFEATAKSVHFGAPSVPYVSPLLARVVSEGGVINASYLSHASRGTVNFQGALEAARAAGVYDEGTIWLEIGPHPACSSMVKSTLGSQVTALASLRKDADSWKVLTETLRSMYLKGVDIDWNEYHRNSQSSQTVLQVPHYSWDLKKYWIQYRNNFCLTKGDETMSAQPTTISDVTPTAAPYLSSTVHRVCDENVGSDQSTLLVESSIHDPRLAPFIQGHKVNTVPLCPSTLYADMAFTVAQYMLKSNDKWTQDTGLDCGAVKIDRPLVAIPDIGPDLLRVSATADWSLGSISLTFFSVGTPLKSTVQHATCVVNIAPRQTWTEDWKRNVYLIQGRISSLHKNVDEGRSHKLKRGLAYKLFGSLVDYENRYQGMQQVVLDSEGLEATAKVIFQVNDEGCLYNPCWIDSLGHISGFIMNGNDNVHSKEQVFINHGWDALRFSKKLEYGKTYETYNKMQHKSGTMYVGDTYVLDEGEIVAIMEGIKFQGVPRRTLDSLLPSKARSPKSSSNQSTIDKPVSQKRGLPQTMQDDAGSRQKLAKALSPKPVSKQAKASSSPSNNNSSRLIAIISEETGLESDELTPGTQFADLGIDSLLSLTIINKLQDELGLDVPSTLFIDYPTVKDLVERTTGSGAMSPVSTAFSTSRTYRTSDDEMAEATAEDTDATSIDESEGFMELVRTTIAQETGTELSDLTPSANFMELGVDSLLALNIISILSEKLGEDLSPSLFTDNETLSEVEKSLSASGCLPPRLSPPVESNKPTTITPSSKQSLPTQPEPQAPPHATSIRLQGSPSTAQKTLFLFPDGSGSAASYANIPRISATTLVYALNCPWLKTPQDLTCALPHYVAKFLIEVRRRQPHGPYYLGGWSAGGIFAYEAAQQLATAGERTEKLVLIDTPNPIGLQNPPQRMYDFLEQCDFFDMAGGNKKPPEWLRPHFDACLRVLDSYDIVPFQRGKAKAPVPELRILYAKDGICKTPQDPRPEIRGDEPREMMWLIENRTDFSGKGGWRDLVGEERFESTVVEGVNHFTMVVAAGEKMEEMARFVRRAMEG